MKLIVEKDYMSLSKRAAGILGEIIKKKPDCSLGLPTGSTPLGIYEELIRMNQHEGLDFSMVKTFNLDEYCGIKNSDPRSYHYYMWKNFIRYVNLKSENIFIPDGNSKNTLLECETYEQTINSHGGMDIILLGLGRNGHIGFNEPDERLILDTHVVKLCEDTIKANSRFFLSKEDVPGYAITMGIGTIMNAKQVLLVVSGKAKADIVKKLLNDRSISPKIPASILHLHKDVTAIFDFKVA